MPSRAFAASKDAVLAKMDWDDYLIVRFNALAGVRCF